MADNRTLQAKTAKATAKLGRGQKKLLLYVAREAPTGKRMLWKPTAIAERFGVSTSAITHQGRALRRRRLITIEQHERRWRSVRLTRMGEIVAEALGTQPLM